MKSLSTGKIRADGNKSIKLNQTLKTSASGKYIIVVIDSGQLVHEVDETNNIAVFGSIA